MSTNSKHVGKKKYEKEDFWNSQNIITSTLLDGKKDSACRIIFPYSVWNQYHHFWYFICTIHGIISLCIEQRVYGYANLKGVGVAFLDLFCLVQITYLLFLIFATTCKFGTKPNPRYT